MMRTFTFALVAALSVAASVEGGKSGKSSKKGKSTEVQARLSSACGCGVDFAPVCCRSASNTDGFSYASSCDAACDSACDTNDTTTSIDAGPCADSDGQGRVGDDDATEFRLIPGYDFLMREFMCDERASYFGPSGSGVSMELCLLGCNSVEDCMFVTYTRSGFCRYW
jgi:hypothetical protein